jgi:hypothetical protein
VKFGASKKITKKVGPYKKVGTEKKKSGTQEIFFDSRNFYFCTFSPI